MGRAKRNPSNSRKPDDGLRKGDYPGVNKGGKSPLWRFRGTKGTRRGTPSASMGSLPGGAIPSRGTTVADDKKAEEEAARLFGPQSPFAPGAGSPFAPGAPSFDPPRPLDIAAGEPEKPPDPRVPSSYP